MSLPSKLTSYSTAGRPIVAAVEPDGITGRVLLGRRAALTSPAGDAEAFAVNIRSVCENHSLAADLADASKRLEDSELSLDAAAARYCSFAARLVQILARKRQSAQPARTIGQTRDDVSSVD